MLSALSWALGRALVVLESLAALLFSVVYIADTNTRDVIVADGSVLASCRHL